MIITNRLTNKDYTYKDCEFMDDGMSLYINKLAEYENSLLEPEEVKQLVIAISQNNFDEWRIKLQNMIHKNYENAIKENMLNKQ